MKIFAKALEIMEREHAGQFREDKKTPYVIHPKAIIELVREQLKAETAAAGLEFDDFPTSEIYLVVAALHDVLEDCKITAADLRKELLTVAPVRFVDAIMAALDAITKREGEPYMEYLTRVRKNTYARLVKIYDITHNMSDLPPGKRRERYALAYYFLTHEIPQI